MDELLPPAGPCPPPERLAGYVEGRLLERERAAVEAHAALCAGCRADLRTLGADAAAAPAPGNAGRILQLRRWLPIAAAAAAVLVAAVLFAPRGGGPDGTDTAAALSAAAVELAEARPDLFRGFRPVGPEDPLPPSLAPRRGALALISPAGKVLDARPRFRWEAVPGVVRWKVTLLTDEGDAVWEAEASGTELAFPEGKPALSPATRYLWEVAGEGPLGPAVGRRAFDAGSDEERAAVGRAAAVIAERAPERIRPLLRAHFALRRGLYEVAEAEALAFAAAEPADPAGRAALDAARRALGRPGAAGDGK